MHAFQVNSHINENGILSIKLPKEWAEKDVNVVLVLEFLNQLQNPSRKKKVWPPLLNSKTGYRKF